MSQRKLFLTGLAVTLLVAQACGSDDGKKRARQGEAGGAGEAGAMEPDSGGTGAGVPGEPPIEGGTGGMPEVTAGTGGAPEVTGGTGGEPDPGPQPELLFTVTPGAVGLDGTTLSDTVNPQNFIYSSRTGSQDYVDGANEVAVAGADLGLAPTDQIVSFTLLQPSPANPLYLFSMADGAEGYDFTRMWQNDDGTRGHVFFSDGVASFINYGEGSDAFGYNGLSSTGQSLGLSPGGGENLGDDLTGLAVHDASKPLTEVFFVVSGAAQGVAGSAVADTIASDKGCTIFKSKLDGTNESAFTCAQLGLVAENQIDAIALFGAGAPTQVVFSVTAGSTGATDTGVNTVYNSTYHVGCTLFESTGNDNNTVLKYASELGLGYWDYGNYDDDIDAITVVDVPQPVVQVANTCQLSLDPFGTGPGGELTNVDSFGRIGNNVSLLFGPTALPSNRILAYNATTCAFAQQKDMPAEFQSSFGWAAVPQAGWAAGSPLDKVEWYRIVNNMDNTGMELQRYDAAGAFVSAFGINGFDAYENVGALLHVPATGQLYAVLDHTYYHQLAVLDIPGAGPGTVDTAKVNLFMPCNYWSGIAGTDSAGNLFLAEPQDTGTDYRVCKYRPNGELMPLPFWWSSDALNDNAGFIVPGAGHFLLRSNVDPIQIERSTEMQQ